MSEEDLFDKNPNLFPNGLPNEREISNNIIDIQRHGISYTVEFENDDLVLKRTDGLGLSRSLTTDGNTVYNFSLNGNNLEITDSDSGVQIIDLSQFIDNAFNSDDRVKLDSIVVSNIGDTPFNNIEKTKLDGIEDLATADQTGSEIKNLYENETNTNVYTDVEKSKLGDIEDFATADQTGEEIKSLYEGNTNTNVYTDVEKTKVAGIEDFATADQTGSEIKSLYESEVNTNAFTDAEKTKVAGLESSHYRGLFVGIENLDNITSPEAGDYADIDNGVGNDVTRYIWDDTDSEWIQQQGIANAETPASIKMSYESNPDTNVFTDTEKSKLGNIEAFATADQTGSEIKNLYENETNTNAFTDVEKTKLDGIEDLATTNDTNENLRDRNTHTGTQDISSISGLQNELDGKTDLTQVEQADKQFSDQSRALENIVSSTSEIPTDDSLNSFDDKKAWFNLEDKRWYYYNIPDGETQGVPELLLDTNPSSSGVVFDDFERPDVDGLPGTSPSGHVWQAVGSGVDGFGGNGSEIRDGRLVLPEGGNHYFFPSLEGGSFGDGVDFIPHHMGAVVRLSPSSSPGSTNALFALIISGPNGLPSAPMIHCTFPNSAVNVEKWTSTDGPPLIEPLIRVDFPSPLEINNRPLVIDFEFDPSSEIITISLEGQPRVSGVFPDLANFLTDRIAWQITQGRDSEGGRIHDCQYDALYAYSEDATGPLAERARLLTLRAQASSIPTNGEVVKNFNEIQNGFGISKNTTQVRIKFGDSGWTSSFWSLFLPNIGDVEIGKSIEFFDDGYGMDPSNTNSRFISLTTTDGATFTNPNGPNDTMRYQGGVARFVLVKDSETQWRLVG